LITGLGCGKARYGFLLRKKEKRNFKAKTFSLISLAFDLFEKLRIRWNNIPVHEGHP